MSPLPPRDPAEGERLARRPIARHGRLRRSHAFRTLLTLIAAAIAVVLVSTACVVGIAVWDVSSSVRKSVHLVDAHGSPIPKIDSLDGEINVLLAGSDSGGGNAAYGPRQENLNDVTMLLHVSADHSRATVVSFPRDMFVTIPSCPSSTPGGNAHGAMSYQKINTSLSYGGLPCTVLTVEKLTGMTIPYAALIQFDGVIEMSNAVGGVPVCVAGDIKDPYTGLDVHAGRNVLQGAQALAFLRTRHGVGDGSDLGRISNQQVFLSSLVRTIKSADTLANPAKVYALAKAAASNMTLSDSLNVSTLASIAVALKNIDLDSVVFVQYPNHYVDNGVAPSEDAAQALFDALQNDRPISLTGGTGIGSELKTPAPSPGPATTAPSAESTPTPEGTKTPGPTPGSTSGAVELPSDVQGQTASEHTCSRPYGQ